LEAHLSNNLQYSTMMLVELIRIEFSLIQKTVPMRMEDIFNLSVKNDNHWWSQMGLIFAVQNPQEAPILSHIITE